jgi:Undecaprenyl-phosphate galactose phosphotransferase WbaP
VSPVNLANQVTSNALARGEIARDRSGIFSLWATTASIVAADILALSVVYWIAVLARYLLVPNYTLAFYLQLYPGIALFLVAFLLQGLYPGILIHPAEEIRRVSYGVTTVFLLIAAATFIARDANFYSRSVFILTWTAGVPAILVTRTLVRHVLSDQQWWGIPAVILGSGAAARRVATQLAKRELGLRVLGICTEDDSGGTKAGDVPVLGPLDSAPLFAAAGAATYAIVALPELSARQARYVIQKNCRGFRHILLIPDLPYACSLCVSALDVGGELGIEVPQRLFHKGAGFTKRTLDLLGSALGLTVLLPLFVLISALVKISSKGPVLYGHARHGLDGKIFEAQKFRTMVTNGPEVLEEYFIKHPDQREIWNREHKLRDDPRVTGPGRWLRRFSIDELPQLFNVLVGQMSLVGPRPIVLNEVDQYGESFGFCTSVRPGITGLWQVSGRNDLAFEERIRFNEYYIRNWSIWLDLYILFCTVRVVIGGSGAY